VCIAIEQAQRTNQAQTIPAVAKDDTPILFFVGVKNRG